MRRDRERLAGRVVAMKNEARQSGHLHRCSRGRKFDCRTPRSRRSVVRLRIRPPQRRWTSRRLPLVPAVT
eukprot:4266464-Prymnesium_polylepis.1